MEEFNAAALLDQHSRQYAYWYYSSAVIAANSTLAVNMTISSDAHFRCCYITGTYTTQVAGPADGGANGCSLLLTDTGRALRLFNQRIPCSLFMSPGRQRVSAIAGDPSNQLFFPIEFNYTFLASSTIELDWQNNLDYANECKIVFMGYKLRKQFGGEEQE